MSARVNRRTRVRIRARVAAAEPLPVLRAGGARRVGVDVGPVGASFAVTLDAPAQKIEALVDVGDHGLLRRQAQAHRGQDLRYLLPQGFRVGLRAGDDQAPVIRVPHQAIVGQTLRAALGPLVSADSRATRGPGDVLVQDREGHVAQQR